MFMYDMVYACNSVHTYQYMYVDRYTALGQAGEYFVRAIEQNDTLTLVDLCPSNDV